MLKRNSSLTRFTYLVNAEIQPRMGAFIFLILEESLCLFVREKART